MPEEAGEAGSPADGVDAEEVVRPVDTVVVRFADTGARRRFRIDMTSNDPDGGVVHVSCRFPQRGRMQAWTPVVLVNRANQPRRVVISW
jgi:hypothetical protein